MEPSGRRSAHQPVNILKTFMCTACRSPSNVSKPSAAVVAGAYIVCGTTVRERYGGTFPAAEEADMQLLARYEVSSVGD